MKFYEILDKYISSDNIKQVTSLYYAKLLLKNEIKTLKIMDLGCGDGTSMVEFTKINQNIDWYGLDIEDSPGVNARKIKSDKFFTYDGINIPFENETFDIIYTHQVFHHVRFMPELLKEIQRVLKPNGCLIGSTSQLEPYQTYSFWNHNVYGFSELVKEAKLEVVEIKHGIDSLTLITRRLLGNPRIFNIWFRRESPLNFLISIAGKLSRKSVKKINAIKLLFCGHFCFYVKKPSNIKILNDSQL